MRKLQDQCLEFGSSSRVRVFQPSEVLTCTKPVSAICDNIFVGLLTPILPSGAHQIFWHPIEDLCSCWIDRIFQHLLELHVRSNHISRHILQVLYENLTAGFGDSLSVLLPNALLFLFTQFGV